MAQIVSPAQRAPMKTITQLKAEVRAHTQAKLFELLQQCERERHIWQELEGDSTSRGGRGHYCERCLRVRLVAGSEYWPALPET